MIAQSFGTNRGFAAVAICAAFLYLVVFPLAPYLIKEVSTTAFIAIASAFCFMQGRLRLREKELAVARERLYQALFDSISHDLRIPLVSITGVLTGLLDENFADEPESRRDLMENALTEAERLRSLVDNLLRMTRLTAGELRVVKNRMISGKWRPRYSMISDPSSKVVVWFWRYPTNFPWSLKTPSLSARFCGTCSTMR